MFGAFGIWSWLCGASWLSDNVYGLSNGSGSGENKGFREPENMTEDHSKISSEENFENAVGESDTASTLNENLSTSMQVVPSVTVSRVLRLVYCKFSQSISLLKLLFLFNSLQG